MSRTGRAFALVLVFAAALDLGADDKKPDGKKDDKKEEFKLTEDEQGIIDLTNAERTGAETKLKPLKMNQKLMVAARKHAENMAMQDKLEHVLDDKNPADRVKAAGYKYKLVGENIAWGGKTPKVVVGGWMESEPHRKNILTPEYTEIGVGMVKNAKGEPYWAQVFGKQ
jgi:uncharacterized protein YkwD